MASSTTMALRVNTVGISNLTTLTPAMDSGSSDRFECGIDRLAAERIESGDQDLAHNGSFAWNIWMKYGVTGR